MWWLVRDRTSLRSLETWGLTHWQIKTKVSVVKLVILGHSGRARISNKTEDWRTKYNSIDFAIDSCMPVIDQDQASAICRGVHFSIGSGFAIKTRLAFQAHVWFVVMGVH